MHAASVSASFKQGMMIDNSSGPSPAAVKDRLLVTLAETETDM
jgi:hypothetical protein